MPPRTLVLALCVILSFMTHDAHSQSPTTTTTSTITLGGVINCRAINLVITRRHGPTVTTQLDFDVYDCEPGETVPHHAVANFHSPIANTDFTLTATTAKLLTTSPFGNVTIDWTVDKDPTSTYDATWRTFGAQRRKQTQHDDFFTVAATGQFGTFAVGPRRGQLALSVFIDDTH